MKERALSKKYFLLISLLFFLTITCESVIIQPDYLWKYPLDSSPSVIAGSSDGQNIVAGSTNNFVYYITSSGEMKWRSQIGGKIYDLAISSDGQYIIVGSDDNKVYYFNNNGALLWTYQTGGPVYSIAISSDGNNIVAGSADGKIYYLLKGGTKSWSYFQNPPVNSVDISSDGKFIIAGFGNGDILFLKDEAPRKIWETSKKIPIGWAVISPDGCYIGAGSYNDGTNKLLYFDKSGFLWNYLTEGKIQAISQSSNGDYFAGGTVNGTLYLLNKNGDLLWKYNTNALISGIEIFPQEQYIAVSTVNNYKFGKLYLFDLNGNILWEYPGSFRSISRAGDKIIAGSFDGNIYLFNKEGFPQKTPEMISEKTSADHDENNLPQLIILENLRWLLIIPLIAILFFVPRLYWELGKVLSNINKVFHKYNKSSLSVINISSISDDTLYIPLLYQNSEENYENRFEELLFERDYTGAIEQCDTALKKNDSDPVALNNKAIVYSLNGRSSDAEEILDTALTHDKTNSVLWYNKGKMLIKNEKIFDAISAFKQSSHYDPDNLFIKYEIGLSILIYLESTDAFQKTIQIDLNDEEIEPVLSLYHEAFMIFEKIKPECKDFPEFQSKILQNQAYIMYKLMHYEKAIDYLNQALTLNFLNVEAGNIKQAIHSDLIKYRKKIRLCKFLLKLYPRIIDIWNGLAKCLCALEQYNDAIKISKHSIKINPENNPADLIQKEVERKLSELKRFGISNQKNNI